MTLQQQCASRDSSNSNYSSVSRDSSNISNRCASGIGYRHSDIPTHRNTDTVRQLLSLLLLLYNNDNCARGNSKSSTVRSVVFLIILHTNTQWLALMHSCVSTSHCYTPLSLYLALLLCLSLLRTSVRIRRVCQAGSALKDLDQAARACTSHPAHYL